MRTRVRPYPPRIHHPATLEPYRAPLSADKGLPGKEYMDRLYRIICGIEMDTALPEDVVVNNWHFRTTDVNVAETPQDTANNMIDQLEEFYQSIDAAVFPSTVGTNIVARAYDLNDPEPRVPVLTRNIPIVPGATDPLPHEVAICMSLLSDVESGDIAARHRGRIYLGPVRAAVVVVDGGRATLGNVTRQLIADAAMAAFGTTGTGDLTADDPKLHIYSRTTDLEGESLSNSFFRVNSVKVDNAFDTQRRRGHAATTATLLRITN